MCHFLRFSVGVGKRQSRNLGSSSLLKGGHLFRCRLVGGCQRFSSENCRKLSSRHVWNCFGSERVRHRISGLLSGLHVVISGIEVLFVFSLQFLHQHCVSFSLLNISIFGSELVFLCLELVVVVLLVCHFWEIELSERIKKLHIM